MRKIFLRARLELESSPFSRATSAVWHEAFLRRLKEHGWIEGANLTTDFRFSDGRTDLLPRLVAQLIDLKPDLLVTEVTEGTAAAQAATHSIPVVMVPVGDPVAAGPVASLTRPGANTPACRKTSWNPPVSGSRC